MNSIIIFQDEMVKAIKYGNLKEIKNIKIENHIKNSDIYVCTALDRGDSNILEWLLENGFESCSESFSYRTLGIWPNDRYCEALKCRQLLINHLYKKFELDSSFKSGHIFPPGCLLEIYFEYNNDRKLITKQLAESLHLKESWIDNIIIGSRRIHPVTAFWMNYSLGINMNITIKFEVKYEKLLFDKNENPFIYPQEFTKPSTEVIYERL